MAQSIGAIDAVANIAFRAVKGVLGTNTKKMIKSSTTMQKVSKISIRPEIGCFVQITGDYNGLVVMNFSAGAAMSLYTNYMVSMGMPEEELAKDFTNSEVPDSLGEMVNQIMGKITKLTEDAYDLTANCGQPKALALNNAIILNIDMAYSENRRISFSIDNEKFYLELAMESAEFIPVEKTIAE